MPSQGDASSGNAEIDVTPEMVSLFAATPPVSPEQAADCRYANEVRAMVAKRHDLDIRKSVDAKLANESKKMADVWAIVLMREARRTEVDAASVVGPLQARYASLRKGAGIGDYGVHIQVANQCDTVLGSMAKEVTP